MLVGCWKKDSSAASPLGATAGLPAVVCRHVQALLGKPAVALKFGKLIRTRSCLADERSLAERHPTESRSGTPPSVDGIQSEKQVTPAPDGKERPRTGDGMPRQAVENVCHWLCQCLQKLAWDSSALAEPVAHFDFSYLPFFDAGASSESAPAGHWRSDGLS
jgi:hypothetical protein